MKYLEFYRPIFQIHRAPMHGELARKTVWLLAWADLNQSITKFEVHCTLGRTFKVRGVNNLKQ